jgi:glycyl-tRNA synthetase alpha chain
VRLADELQFSVYNFEQADVPNAVTIFSLYEQEGQKLIDNFKILAKSGQDGKKPNLGWFPLLPAYDLCLKCSHLFNILDARGAISVTERVRVIARVRALAVGIARAWVDQQGSEAAGGGDKSDEEEPVHEKRMKKGKLSPVGS